MPTEPTPPSDDQLLEDAARWFARMRGPDAEASRAEFDDWLKSGEGQRRAYNRVSEIFAMGKLLNDDEPAAPAARQRSKAALALTVILATMLAFAAWLVLGATISPNVNNGLSTGGSEKELVRIATGPAHTEEVRLDDGTRVRLAADTSLLVRFTPGIRKVELEQGTARFDVAHESRPFVVRAGGGEVTALGTLFEVRLSPSHQVTVRLLQGRVRVVPAGGRNPTEGAVRERRLEPGETMTYASGPTAQIASSLVDEEGVPGLHPPSGSASDFEGVRLAEIVDAANRGARRPIRLSAVTIGELRVSGRFRINDTLVLAERLAQLFGLVLDVDDPGEIVLRQP